MNIEPAHVDQIRRARDGRMVIVDADAGGVAENLRRIDPHLKVRFAEHGNPPFWAVYHESDDGRTTTLVTTAQAYQTNSGVWTGLDGRIVKRVARVGHESYDLAGDLESINAKVKADRREKIESVVSSTLEHGAHALRKDLGIQNRIFVR